MTVLEARNLPRHVAIIMDGNGRWAELQGRPRTAGHRAGSDAVRRIVRLARRLGVEQLTLYAFSEQNWGRPQDEVEALMALLHEFLLSEREEILSNAIHLRAVGSVERLPQPVREVLEPLSQRSAPGARMVLSLALSYGGREEIAAAARTLARKVARGQLSPEDVTEELLAAHIPSVAYGEPDLIIRTGGEFRISNFLLWGSAYAELFFSPTLWPDFAAEDLFQAISAYQRRERRFGLVPSVASNGHGAHANGSSALVETQACPTSPSDS
ncbi:MAG: di-trans,poly-cis-decaprenylcistransferase [Deltaproteobacteria bacterium]|nr:di-trans,poly-cis-decaprenylcistransferase [Deltaproteobacteria bacterium]